ncbi:hypothetical protein GQ42DRAFT_162418 [Ramicandelaber brevisporus]|nr:hypothetical protein GQ42DRAFT_162418 [Ramicandelaber brevisporus]
MSTQTQKDTVRDAAPSAPVRAIALLDQIQQALTQLFIATDPVSLSGQSASLRSTQQQQQQQTALTTSHVMSLIELDKQLNSTIKEAIEHQKRQRALDEMEKAIEACEAEAKSFARTLLNTQMTLRRVAREAKENEEAVSKSQRARNSNENIGGVNVEEVLSYAQRLAKYTFAPPNYDPANAAIPAEPPYPLEPAMRSSILEQHRTGVNVSSITQDVASAAAAAAGKGQQQAQQQVQHPTITLSGIGPADASAKPINEEDAAKILDSLLIDDDDDDY